MPDNVRTEFERARDLAVLATLYKKGRTQEEMAQHLTREFYAQDGRSISRQQVTYDVRELIADWRRAGLADVHQQQITLLARLEYIQSEALDAWERSKGDYTKTRTERLDEPDVEEVRGPYESPDGTIRVGTIHKKKGGQRIKATIETERGFGDPRYLAVATDAADKSARILRLYDVIEGGEDTFVAIAMRLSRQRMEAAKVAELPAPTIIDMPQGGNDATDDQPTSEQLG